MGEDQSMRIRKGLEGWVALTCGAAKPWLGAAAAAVAIKSRPADSIADQFREFRTLVGWTDASVLRRRHLAVIVGTAHRVQLSLDPVKHLLDSLVRSLEDLIDPIE